jgi:hypothetical protein
MRAAHDIATLASLSRISCQNSSKQACRAVHGHIRQEQPATAPQTTVVHTVSFSGVGLHSGQTSAVHIHPAPPNSGIVFVLPGAARVPASFRSVLDCTLSTTLCLEPNAWKRAVLHAHRMYEASGLFSRRDAGWQRLADHFWRGVGVTSGFVRTVEHLMAAFSGLMIDNACVEVHGGEVPGLLVCSVLALHVILAHHVMIALHVILAHHVMIALHVILAHHVMMIALYAILALHVMISLYMILYTLCRNCACVESSYAAD